MYTPPRHPVLTLRKHPLARAIFAATLTLSGALLLPALCASQQAQASNEQKNYAIPAGPLGPAITRFSGDAGVVLSFDPALTQGRQTAGLNGSYSIEQGFALLLNGSGLNVVRNEDGSWLLIQAAVSGEMTLGPVNINSQRHGVDATSEGTGTYAAQATTIFKGAKTLKEIPQSVSVITRQQMDDQGLTELEDVYAQLPGARLDGYDNQQRIMSRGFQSSTQIDGVPQALQEGLYTLDPAIYDRVEMLRGPAGILTGSAEPGGTVNLVRKRPLDHFSLSGKTSYGSWNSARTEIDITGPLNDSGSLRGRAVGVLQDKDEFYDTAHNRREVIYGALEYEPTSQDTFGLSIAHMKNESNIFWGLPRYTDGSLPGRKSYVGADDVDNTDTVTEYILDYSRRFENEWTAKATYTHRNEELHRGSAFAMQMVDKTTNLANTRVTYWRDKLTHDAYDINLSGPFELFEKKHHATIGHNSASSNLYGPDWVSRFFSSADLFNNTSWGGFGPSNNDGAKNKTKQSGIYGSLSLQILDPLTFIIGGRTTDFAYESRASYASSWVDGQKESGEFTPYGALVLNVNKNISLYTSYAEIFVPQTAIDYSDRKLPPRTGEQYELGIKGSFLNEKLNTSFAIYQLRDQNRSITDLDPNHICPQNFNNLCSTAAGLIQSRGFEAEVSGSPALGLNISASWTYNRSKILRDANAELVGTTPTPYRNPKHLIKLWTTYNFSESPNPEILSKWNIGGGFIAQSKVHTTTDSGSEHHQGSYAIFSADAGYKINKNLKIDLSVENIFDKVYLRELGADTYYNYYGDPRNYKITLSYKY